MNTSKPVLGILIAAGGAGKDTVVGNVLKLIPEAKTIHMSSLLEPVWESKAEYKKLRDKGELLPPEEAVKAFRRGFIGLTAGKSAHQLPHILGNGPCRDPFETDRILRLIRLMRRDEYDIRAIRLTLRKESILERAQQRTLERQKRGLPPRTDDLGNTPIDRYCTFMKNAEPIIEKFEKKGVIIHDIDAALPRSRVACEVASIYKPGFQFDLSLIEGEEPVCIS